MDAVVALDVQRGGFTQFTWNQDALISTPAKLLVSHAMSCPEIGTSQQLDPEGGT